MKRNKVPEKIYLSAIDLENMGDCIREPLDKYDIEYTRTDAFIEKAAEWLKLYVLNHDTIDIFEMEDDFKKAMKGE